eukprot:3818482-Alexandrium_andersonii.AAC.1
MECRPLCISANVLFGYVAVLNYGSSPGAGSRAGTSTRPNSLASELEFRTQQVTVSQRPSGTLLP